MVYVKHLRAMDDLGVIMIWEWETKIRSLQSPSSGPESASGCETNTHSDDDTERTESTVTFKFIGVTKEARIQNILK